MAFHATHADLGAPIMLSKLVKLLNSPNAAIVADISQVCLVVAGVVEMDGNTTSSWPVS